MGRKKQKYYEYDDLDYEEEDVERCPDCNSTNLYFETMTAAEWVGGREVRKTVIQYYCLEEKCGCSWKK